MVETCKAVLLENSKKWYLNQYITHSALKYLFWDFTYQVLGWPKANFRPWVRRQPCSKNVNHWKWPSLTWIQPAPSWGWVSNNSRECHCNSKCKPFESALRHYPAVWLFWHIKNLKPLPCSLDQKTKEVYIRRRYKWIFLTLFSIFVFNELYLFL